MIQGQRNQANNAITDRYLEGGSGTAKIMIIFVLSYLILIILCLKMLYTNIYIHALVFAIEDSFNKLKMCEFKLSFVYMYIKS